MSGPKSHYDLFGLDLALVGRYFRDGWAEAVTWPVFRWMRPRSPVRVLDAEGRVSTRLAMSSAPVEVKGVVARSAVELPESLILRRSLVLPRLTTPDLEAAVALDARSASPFAEGDLVWGFDQSLADGSDAVHIELVLSSRALIERHLAGLDAAGLPFPPEVWAGGVCPVRIRGFGESTRARNGAAVRWVNVGLLVLGLMLLVALALTPLLQLRFRVIDAIGQHGALQEKSVPQIKLRSDLMAFNVSLERLDGVVRAYANPLVILDELSQLLPDDVVVSALEFKGNTVRIAGQANNAARLLDLLASKPAYHEVKAPAATTRVPGSTKEYFTIEFKINRAEKNQ